MESTSRKQEEEGQEGCRKRKNEQSEKHDCKGVEYWGADGV